MRDSVYSKQRIAIAVSVVKQNETCRIKKSSTGKNIAEDRFRLDKRLVRLFDSVIAKCIITVIKLLTNQL